MRTVLPCLLALLILAGCRSAPADIALGSIEWDRVELVATAAEPITAIAVREGDSIDKDALVLEQRADRAEADLAAAAELDRSGASAELARSELAAARASDDLLRAGTRREALAQTEAAVAAAEQRVEALRITRERLQQRAPVAGRIESLPLDVGDTPAAGATMATLLVGRQPYARVHLSPALRSRTKIGSRYAVKLQGHDGVLNARVRMLAAQAGFTPYFALSGDDANRLTYLAELEFDAGTALDLAAGLPVQATLQP